MQILVQVICKKGKSLRDSIVNNKNLTDHLLKASEQKKMNRSKGWAKIHSTEQDRHGAINIEWDSDTSILIARVITKGKGKPNLIIGDFIDFLFSQYRQRIQAVNIIPR